MSFPDYARYFSDLGQVKKASWLTVSVVRLIVAERFAFESDYLNAESQACGNLI